jgi:hypothetical protein
VEYTRDSRLSQAIGDAPETANQRKYDPPWAAGSHSKLIAYQHTNKTSRFTVLRRITMRDQDIHHPKMLELVRRLTLGTQQGVVQWNGGRADSNSFQAKIADKVISVKVEEQFGEVLVQVSDASGSPLVGIDSTRTREPDERKLFHQLLQVVQKKEGGIDKMLDEILTQLPER